MTADRAVSTPIDVVLGLLLIAIATAVVATAVPAPAPEPPADVQPAILGSTVTVEYETDAGRYTVRETVGGVVADGALAGYGQKSARKEAFREAISQRLTAHIETHGAHVQLIGACRDTVSVDPLIAGRTPPDDTPVRATVYQPPPPAGSSDCQPVVVLRRWSP